MKQIITLYINKYYEKEFIMYFTDSILFFILIWTKFYEQNWGFQNVRFPIKIS